MQKQITFDMKQITNYANNFHQQNNIYKYLVNAISRQYIKYPRYHHYLHITTNKINQGATVETRREKLRFPGRLGSPKAKRFLPAVSFFSPAVFSKPPTYV